MHVKVLLIEDNPDHAEIFRDMLAENKGIICDVEQANRLSKGLECLADGNIDIVLLDLMLPDSQGVDAFTKVHAQAPDVPVMVLSALDDEDIAIKAVNAGAQDYLVKGQFTGNLLKRSIRYAIERNRMWGALRESERELRIRNRIAEIFLTIPDNEMYAEVLKVILETMESEYGVFGYIDRNKNLVCPSMTRAIWSNCQVSDKSIVFPHEKWGNSLWCQAIREKKGLYSNDPSSVPQGHVLVLRNMAVPVINQENVIGLIHVANKATDYNEKDLNLLETVADHIAPVLHAKLERDRHDKEREYAKNTIQRKNQMQTLLNNILTVALDSRSLEEILDRILDQIVKVSRPALESRGAVFLVEEKSDMLILKSYKGFYPEMITKCAGIPFGKCLCGWSAVTKKIQFANSSDKHHDIKCRDFPPHAHYCVPILYSDKVLGVLNVYLREGHKRDEEDEDVLQSIANVLAGIIERKRAEDALRKSEEKYRTLIENVNIGIYRNTGGDNGGLLQVNQAMLDMFGYETREEFLGTSVSAHYQDSEERKLFVKEILSEGFVKNKELRLCKKDGTPFTASCSAQVKFNERGQVEWIDGVLEDITERKEAEMALKARQGEIEDLNASLEMRVQEELEKSRQKDLVMMHQSRLAAMGEMIGNIAHQWKQPLNALNILLYNIKDFGEDHEIDGKEFDTYIEKGVELIMKMAVTIDDFRNFFKPNKQKDTFCINKIVKESLSLVDASLKYNNISVVLNEGEGIDVFGFSNEYSQVILNVLNNAKDAIVANGVIGEIKIDVFSENGSAVVKMRDNGGGIPEKFINTIFDPYFTTKEEGKGTGIGLYMSKVIIEDHMGGHVGVRNIKKGAEFKIVTPLTTPN